MAGRRPCNCGGRSKQVVIGGELLGYYVDLPDGSRVPAVNIESPDDGEAPFMNALQARVVVTNNGGGTIRALKRPAPA
ncbi:hypothetical protein PBI_THONKO_9 [Mycobacterium phage Thonko]|uniref:DUF7196 domain-containing protein n=1 Tax=Mycobacterium phage Thonko TaxID=2282910 RepID=A0A346FC56_9CAUD|nr:hypothetical protein I5G57_gp009 [Mycobacterium phage Thonko]AXN53281.1 hypothetical protein PBI_THONKO_9 [Mycobacterium phage Thonko]